jgi:hypothetical protein
MNRRRSHRYGLRRGCGARAPLAVQRRREQTTTATLARSNTTNGTHKSRPRHSRERSASQASDDHANSAPRLGGG